MFFDRVDNPQNCTFTLRGFAFTQFIDEYTPTLTLSQPPSAVSLPVACYRVQSTPTITIYYCYLAQGLILVFPCHAG